MPGLVAFSRQGEKSCKHLEVVRELSHGHADAWAQAVQADSKCRGLRVCWACAWVCTGCVLGMLGVYWLVLGVYWVCTGCVLACTGCVLGMYWVCTGCVPRCVLASVLGVYLGIYWPELRNISVTCYILQ